ncbi:MAG: hypothetical protein ICV68_09090, partial [Pyrinomonadaceae bacterium]|nr:hypothetical protein [Pyrinomonadaceae bacterium]
MLSLSALSFIGMRATAANSVTPLPSFDGVHTGPRASGSPTTATNRPVNFKFERSLVITPITLAPRGSATLTTTIQVNPYAANWTAGGNLLTVGFLRELGETTVDGNTPFAPAHDFDPAIWFQNNNPSGIGMCWNKKFFINGNFEFGDGAVCGLPEDNSAQNATEPGSYIKYAVTIFADNTFELRVTHLDADGELLTNLNSIGANPQILTGTLPHPVNSNYFPYIRQRVGYDTGGNGIANPDSDWTITTSASQLVTSEPTLVSPSNLNGWVTQVSGTASVTFRNGPGAPPLGTGSVELATGADGNSAAQVRYTGTNGVLLSNLTTFKYSTYVSNDSSAPPVGDQTPYV